jgi:CubicO group peptidase (beta-lactamase class C family)
LQRLKSLNALKALAALTLLVGATTPDDVYRTRFAALMANPAQFDYSPMEAVPGAPRLQPLRPATRPRIATPALEEAARYAEVNRSSALLVWRDGGLEAARYFGATTRDTPLVSKSLAKPLTAIAVGRAIMLGKIKGLDQPIADFISELKGTPKAAILVRHLLDMRSGLLDQGFSPDPEHPWNRAYLDPDHGAYIVRDYPLTDAPGTRYAYANAPSELVALVIERATRRRYAEFLSREVLAPLGAAGGEVWVNRPQGLAHSGCCIKLPAETWMKLAILLLDDGKAGGKRLLPKGYVRAMRTGTPQNPNFGLGIWLGEPYRERRGFGAPGTAGPQVLHSQAYLDPEMFLFDGNSNQTVHVSPRHRLIVLRMGETPPKTPEWDNAYLPNLLIGGLGPR